MQKSIVLLVGLLLPALSFGKFPSELKAVLDRYARSSGLRIELEKKVRLAVLGKESLQKGEALAQKGLLRLTLEEPEKSLVVVGSRTIWFVSQNPDELGGELQVGKTKRSNKQAPVFATLLSGQDVSRGFQVLDSKREGAKAIYNLKPQRKNPDVEKLRVAINGENKEICEISYADELENETTFRFLKSEFNKKLDQKLFDYTPPPGAKVTEY